MESKNFVIVCSIIFGLLLTASTEANPIETQLATGSAVVQSDNQLLSTQVRKSRQYYGGHGGYPGGGYGYGGYPGGYGGYGGGGSSASASASASSFGGFGK